MGTSISQGSPTGASDAGESWKTLDQEFASGLSPKAVIPKIIDSYKAQFGENANMLIVDKGVLKVEAMLSTFNLPPQQSLQMACANFMVEAKKELAYNGENSFFAEMAVSSASSAILAGENVVEQFKKNFLTSIADYIISRDQVIILGNRAVPNLYSKKNYIEAIRREINSLKADKSLIELLGLK